MKTLTPAHAAVAALVFLLALMKRHVGVPLVPGVVAEVPALDLVAAVLVAVVLAMTYGIWLMYVRDWISVRPYAVTS
jgi:hypothetical protein